MKLKNSQQLIIWQSHISIITLNVKELNSPMKRHRVTGWIKNKTQIYAADKRLTTALRTYIDSNDEKRHFM